MNRNMPVLSLVMALIIGLRCVFDKNERLIYIVAVINVVAIVYVLFTILDNIANRLVDKVIVSNVPQQILKREKRSIRIKVWAWGCSINLILIIAYFWFWCSNLGNDIISIIALGISIMDDDIVKLVIENYRL